MKRNLKLLFWSGIIPFFIYCNSSDELPPEPKISFLQLSKSRLNQGDINQDSLWLDFQFEDGDGDLGYGGRDERKDITIFDSRTGNVHDQYKLPDLPSSGDETQKGRISILVFTTCCLFPGPIPPCSTPVQHPLDSLEFQIQLIDRAGHQSNLISSGKVYLNCL